MAVNVKSKKKTNGARDKVVERKKGRSIDERRLAEEAFRESEERLRLCIATAHLGTYDWDIASDRHVWSPQTYAIYGLPFDTLLTTDLLRGVVFPEDRRDDVIAAELDPATSHGGYSLKYRITRASDHSVRWINTKTRVFFSGEGAERRAVRTLGIVQDITERKQAEEALRMIQFALDEFSDSAIWLSPEGDVVYVNETACNRHGYTKEELLSMHIWDIDIDRDYRPDLFKVTWDTLKKHGTLKFESRHKTSAGGIFPVEVTARYIRYGEKEYLISFDRDITERKLIEEALKERETFLSNLFASIQDGISVLDKDLNIVSVNPVMEKWYGEGIAGKKCYEVYHSRDSPCEKCPSIRAIRDKATQTEVVQDIRTWVEIFAYPYLNDSGDVTGVIEQVRDITERKMDEEALNATLERFYTILSNMHAGMLLVTPDDRVEFANQAFCDYFGLYEPPAKLAGLSASEMIEKIKGAYSDPDGAISRITEVVGERRPVIGEEIAMSDGRACLCDFIPLYIQGKQYGRLWVYFDITERKQAEKSMAVAKARAELYLDLMGHDINNMNQIALGYLELAQGLPPGVQQGEMIGKSVEVLQRSTQLIQNVGKLQKLDSGALLIREIDVAGVLVDVQREYESPNKMVTLNLNGNERCYVLANELLYDVFANLIGNAIKHTGDGTSIAIDLADVQEDGGRYYRVSVDDNGPGIHDDFKARIFNRLSRGTSKAKGMGLGLYLVKTLVVSYDGRVWAEDRIAGDHTKGVRFVVMLPAVD
ncbi:MAG TPA: PAS domain S-box protein [Methanocella sp.]|nr:PAS domain S-box protein [Methanocella sp.]